MRATAGCAPVSKAGRRWLAALELPIDERLTLNGCLRQIDFLDTEIGRLDAVIAREALSWLKVPCLMTVSGVNVQTVATFMAAVADIRRPFACRIITIA